MGYYTDPKTRGHFCIDTSANEPYCAKSKASAQGAKNQASAQGAQID